MVQTCSTELNKLKGQLAAAYQQINALQGGKEEVNGFYTFIFHSLNVRPILDIAYLRGVITMMYHNPIFYCSVLRGIFVMSQAF